MTPEYVFPCNQRIRKLDHIGKYIGSKHLLNVDIIYIPYRELYWI